MSVSQLNILMILCFVLAGALLVLAIVLYFVLDITYAIGVISGFSARKGVAAIGAKQKTIKDLDPITDKLADRNKNQVPTPSTRNINNVTSSSVPVQPTITAPVKSLPTIDELGQTSVLSNDVSNSEFGETTDLTVFDNGATTSKTSDFKFVCIEEVRFTAGTSVI